MSPEGFGVAWNSLPVVAAVFPQLLQQLPSKPNSVRPSSPHLTSDIAKQVKLSGNNRLSSPYTLPRSIMFTGNNFTFYSAYLLLSNQFFRVDDTVE